VVADPAARSEPRQEKVTWLNRRRSLGADPTARQRPTETRDQAPDRQHFPFRKRGRITSLRKASDIYLLHGTGSSDIALAKSGCYSTLTWWVLNHWIVNKQLRFNTGPYEQSSLQCYLQYRYTVSVMTTRATVFYLQ
jgi:hypothetical protein